MPLAEAFEVVVTVEPEWDDEQRERMLALALYERSLCDCGWPRALCRDPATHFRIVNDDPCQIDAALAKYRRLLQQGDERLRRNQNLAEKPGAPDPADGRRFHIELKPLNPIS